MGRDNGLDQEAAVDCDDIQTIPSEWLGRQIGFLLDDQEAALSPAVQLAFDLD